MVWEQGVVVIVNLTPMTDSDTVHNLYWPTEGGTRYHFYEVHLVSEHVWCDDYLVRSFYLKNTEVRQETCQQPKPLKSTFLRATLIMESICQPLVKSPWLPRLWLPMHEKYMLGTRQNCPTVNDWVFGDTHFPSLQNTTLLTISAYCRFPVKEVGGARTTVRTD